MSNRDLPGLLERVAHEAVDVHRFVAARVNNPADAEDIAQDALCAACANIGAFRHGNLRAWLFTIARRKVADHYRARYRQKFVEVTEAALAEAEPALRTAADALQVVCDCRQELRSWGECLARDLRIEEQVAVVLADVHGYPDKDSAARLGLSLASFKLLLHHARARLLAVTGGRCTVVEPPDPGPVGVEPAENLISFVSASNPRAGAREGSTFDVAEAPVRGNVEKGSGGGQPANGSCGVGCRCAAAGSAREGARCCVGNGSCLSRRCHHGVGCPLGIKCCRQAPRLLDLRSSLLAGLGGALSLSKTGTAG